MYKEKRRGDRGHPCLTPFVGCTRTLFSPSIKMYSSFSYICLITLSKVGGIALWRRCDQNCCHQPKTRAVGHPCNPCNPMWCPTKTCSKDLQACSWNLACTFRGCFEWLWRAHFSMALGFQWTKYCSWDVGICQSPWALPSFGADLLPVNYFVYTVVKLMHLVLDSFGCLRLVCQLFCTLSLVLPEQPRLWKVGYMMDLSYDPCLPLRQKLALHII